MLQSVRALSALLLAPAVAPATAPATAQIPEGQVVVSSFYYTGNPGGLFVFDPRVPGPPTPIEGLSSDLDGDDGTIWSKGANCVSILEDGNRDVAGRAGHGDALTCGIGASRWRRARDWRTMGT